MDSINILTVIAILLLVVAAYFDVNSTMQFLKRGTAQEGNGLIAWLQRTFPTSWPSIKICFTVIVALAAWWLFPPVYGLGVIIVLALYTALTARFNYDLSK